MKKIVTITLISFFMMSLTSCFLFQKHQDCPAYGINKEKETENNNLKTFDTSLEEEKA